MKLTGYGVELTRLTQEDIELVRVHRNSFAINQYMEFREEISEEQQLNWFKSIDNLYNNYFIIKVNHQKIGLIYGANIDWNKKETGNGGIFIWEEKYWNSKASIGASFLLTETSILMALKKTFIKVLSTNKEAIAYNKSLGYQLIENQEGVLNQKYVLLTSNYIKRRGLLREKIFEQNEYTTICLTLDSNTVVGKFYIDLIKNLPEANKRPYTIKIKD